MAYEISQVDIWAGGVDDMPGELAWKLETIMQAEANLDFVIARPIENQPCMGVLYLAPLQTEAQTKAAEEVGLHKSGIQVLRIEGPDRPKLAAEIARMLADVGINIHGVSAAAIGERAILYLRFDSAEDVSRAKEIVAAALD